MTIDLGTIARERRQEMGLTRRQVGDMACCSESTVKAFENCKRGIGMDFVLSIYGALGLKIVVEEEERKKGKWMLRAKDDGWQTRVCSLCDAHWLGHTWEKPPRICSHCGAKMEE